MALALLMKAILLCETAVVVTSQGPTEAQLQPMAILWFQHMDRNGDGWISLAEFFANFDDIDKNKDGMWTLREYSGLPSGTPIPEPVKKRFNYYDRFDGNRDGKVQRSQVERLFQSYDLNGDFRITLEEIITFITQSLGPVMRGKNQPPENK